ncbi:hypothetical protein EX30DRAFT_340068 [Ascodesmis nigricans]|uniref:Uncharacterized protein n=1 Tax=Ascodesmis nigricans TaxID=341454 RepID=A0A4S2MZL7_9PEZI|nr:hypothetical protein EX30DRAFT_340068 [Ascodesmis nigricans]
MPPIRPIISIKAGKCNVDGTTVMPVEEPGILYIYLNPDEELHHLCWKPRSATEPEIDLLIIPSDARFLPYEGNTTGRIFVLKFSSSSARHFFWLQSKAQHESDAGFWSERDLEWGRRIDTILQGDGDEEMGDAPVQSAEIEQEGEESRRGGEDGGRAQTQPQGDMDLAALIRSIQVPGGQQQQQTLPPISLHDLLSTSSTLPTVDDLDEPAIIELAKNLPEGLFPDGSDITAKRRIMKRVIQSPQFAQSLVSLTTAIREGGIAGVAESLRVPIDLNEARSGADLVEVFVKGVKKQAEKEDTDQ